MIVHCVGLIVHCVDFVSNIHIKFEVDEVTHTINYIIEAKQTKGRRKLVNRAYGGTIMNKAKHTSVRTRSEYYSPPEKNMYFCAGV